jgi:DNA-binding winged helix-turn-helix (wHTH) protein
MGDARTAYRGCERSADYAGLRAGFREADMEFVFGTHRLDIERRELRRGEELIPLQPQVFDLLVYLLRNRDRVLSKDDLLNAVWAAGSCRSRR